MRTGTEGEEGRIRVGTICKKHTDVRRSRKTLTKRGNM